MRLDLLVRAGTILTMDEDRPTAREMGIIGGRIVGFDEELAGCTADRTEDFGEATITPGFIDAHCHTTWWGLGLAALDLSPARGLEELYALLESEVYRLAATPGVWLNGTGFNHKNHDGQFPDIKRLDAITGDRPLYLRHVSGHASITNTATLKLAGALEPGFADPVGGAVVRDAQGSPTGLVEESAQGIIQKMLLPYSADQIVGALDAATARYAAEGITSFTEAGIGGGWIGHSPVEVTAYQRALAAGKLHARAQLMPTLDALRGQESHAADAHGTGTGLGLDLGITAGFGNEHLSLGPVKVFMDGSLLGATAAVTEDYCGHQHNTGYLLDDPQAYRERVAAAYRSGWPVALHAIGDAAIDLAIEIISGLQEKHGPNALPNRIEHFGIARPDQVEAVARHGIAVTPQASFIGPLGDQFAKLVGLERQGWLYRGQSLLDAGVLVAGSSDLPVADNNVRRAMASAVDRLTEKGLVLGGAAECLSPLEALRLYTVNAAKATGLFADRGSLARGKLADFVVLSESPLLARNIADLQVMGTFVGGRQSHARADNDALATA
ncbi:amidohydrolase [Paeniglutamicibacter sulfureus]|uniref:Amidohydrolase YtcJ n=1 Tax=Paeniglutamicibacter sulfureus TaxID=43666 RepID=A0ABU2BL66_9MICC|nr:amidohydrolase [Paeniglutamicibacter sulfureus]MDR7359358.1 putative amidohydrolase YtcJ [Paeniglutamicibacter sulfureus]